MLHRLWKTAAAGVALLLLGGCWSSDELNNRAFVSVIIVDRTDDGIELTLGTPLTTRLIPGQTGGTGGVSGQPSAFVTRTGGSLEEALQKIQGDLSRKVAFGQTRCIIISRRFAEQGIEPMLEFVVRNPFLRLGSHLFLVEGPARSKVAETPVYFERFFASVLNGYIRNHQILRTTVKDLMFSQANGGDGLIPVLRFTSRDAATAPGAPQSVGTAGAVILRNGKVAEPTLTPEDTSSARSILAQLKQYYYSVPSPTDGKPVGLYTTSLLTDVTPFRNGDRLGIRVHILSRAGVIGSDSNMDLTSEKNIARLEATVKQMADKGVTATIAKTRQAGADVFNFARYLSVQYPHEWRKIKDDWRNYYRDRLDIRIDNEIAIRRVGASTDSFRSKFLDAGERAEERE